MSHRLWRGGRRRAAAGCADAPRRFPRQLWAALTLALQPHPQPRQFDAFAKGTFAIANELATMDDCITIIGGGDSVAAVEKAGVAEKVRRLLPAPANAAPLRGNLGPRPRPSNHPTTHMQPDPSAQAPIATTNMISTCCLALGTHPPSPCHPPPADVPHLHRRRRLPGAAGGQGAAR